MTDTLDLETLDSDEEHPFTRRKIILTLLLLTLFLIAAVFLQERESGWFSTWATYRVRRDQLTMTRPPEWVTDPLPATLFDSLVRWQGGKTTAGSNETIALLDDRLTPEIRRILEAHPAVKRVERIRRLFPAGLTIAVEYGTPVCLVVVEPGTPQPWTPPSTSEVTAATESILQPEFYLIGPAREVLAKPNAELADRLMKQYAKVVVPQRLLREGDFCVDSRVVAVLGILRCADAKMTQQWDEIRLVPITDGYHIVLKAGENEIIWGESPTNPQATSINSRTEWIQAKLEQLAKLTMKYGTLRSTDIPESEKTLKDI